MVIDVLPGHKGRIGHHDHTHSSDRPVLAVDGTKVHANASERATRDYEQLAREVLHEAAQIDGRQPPIAAAAAVTATANDPATRPTRRTPTRVPPRRSMTNRVLAPFRLSGVELVVLSACQTAVKDRKLVDESIGFPSALLVAGVPAVVSTTWIVADDAAPFFTHRLYVELLSGSDAARATRAAQRWLRDATGRDLLRVVRELRAPLDVDDLESDTRLADLAYAFDRAPDARPFSGPEHWAAFPHQGI